MEVVKSVNKWVSSWSTGGEQACRAFLSPHHANPLDATSVGALFDAYQALLFATLASWSTKATIPHETFTTFVQSVLESLPSSSSLPSTAKSTVGEQLVDMIWSLDAQLDDIINDAKAASSNTNAEVASKAKDSKLRAEGDKMTIIAIVKRLLAVGIIKPVTAAERLDSALLASAGLFPDKVTLDKKEIRTRTGLFYKQNKFNLLREQSEGYSKLTTELTSSLGPPHSPSSGRPAESLEAIEERARPVWDKIISLIGYFDLDPNRALDIILDIFCVHIATHYTFFVALLSFSPWCGSYKRRIASSMSVDSEATPSEGKSLDDILAACEATETDCSSGHRPRVLAQVLGFKFAFHNTPDAPQPAPRNLYLTAALLIREKFITLEDIYPHLTLNDPEDGGLGAYKDTVKARIAAAKVSQLAMAAPLESTSTTTTTARAKEKSPSEAKDPPDQKSGIVAALLSIGSLRPALWVLSKYPWMVDAHPDIADLMIRVMKVSMNPLYETTLVQKPHNASFLQPRSRYSAAGIAQPAPRKQVLTLWAPTPPCTHSTEFVFFYPDWIENVPICNTLDDLMNIIDPLLAFVKLHISRDVIFMTKFLRLGRKQLHGTIPSDPSMKPDTEHPVRQFWLKALRSYILPGVSLLRGNAVCNVEVWNMVKLYGLTERWCLYGEWKSSLYDQHTELSVRKVEADRESKAILRRLSHNTIESLSGPIAKLAHSNPCIFFANVVNQVMAYDNLAGVVVLGLVYVTVMGFDVLVYIILDAMSNTYKDRVKDDGVNTSDWLQSLASFTGMLYRRYGADLSPVLQYIVHQLQNRVSTDIVVLRELIWKMAGIEPLPSLSESQVAAMAGGPALRIEAVASATRGARVDPGDLGMRGPGRLGRALVETGLALPLLVQVAQQRQTAIFSNKQAYLKSLAGLYDTTHGVLLQYIELLTSPSVVALDDYAKKVLPPIGDLSEKYGISAPICMQVLRPVLNNALLKSAIAKEERDHAANQEQEKRLKAALKAKQDPTTTASRVASPVPKTEKAGDASVKPVTEDDTPMDVDTTQVSPASTSPWLPELEELFEELKRVVPERAYNTIGPGFYLTFWQLSTYDLAPPGSRYDDETSNLRTLSRQEDAKALNAERSNDRRIRSTASAHRARRERYNQFIQTLNAEFKNQTISRAFTLKRISREKAHWFAHGPPANLLVEALVQNCIIPRCLLSPMDADYAAQMVRVLHASGTPGFNTLLCYDTILADMPKAILFSCSEYEARNYGRFLHAILADLYKWHLDEQVFVQDNRTKVGGKYVSHPGMKMKFRSDTEHMPWDSFRQILRKWHTRLVIGFRASLQTGEFMHIYNTFLVLKELLPVFPIAEVAGHAGRFLDEAISVCLANEKRRDLAILGGAYAASLKKREAFWHPPTPTNPSTVNGSSPAPAANTAAVPTKPRNAPPTGPNSSMNGDSKRGNGAPTQVAPVAPSGPRAQPPTPALPEKPANGATGTGPKLSVEGIARPPVTKRIQREHDSASPKPSSELARPIPTGPAAVKDGVLSQPSSRRGSPAINDLSHRSLPRDIASVVNSSPLGREPPKSPRNHRTDEKPARAESQPQPVMPPPAAPSQTTSAQELRENAKQSRYDKPADDKRIPLEPRSQTGSAAASPKQRSPSPMSRPGTRNSSADSRGSRSRKPTESDDRRANKDKDARDNIRRDSLTIPTRLLRDEKDERERERDRGDRGGRDKHERDRRDKERDRERGDRERERDRNGESRDRHRRGDEKDRDRKDREGSSIRGSAVASSGRTEDLKRKRGEEEPSDRSRRSSRKDGSHREDRSRRSEKDAHDRDSRLDRGRDHDRRSRRDRPPSEDRGSGGDKSSDRRPAEPAATSTSKLPPSQPRAERSGKPEAPVVGEQEKPGNGEDQEVTNPGIKKDATEPSLLQRIDTTTTNNTNPPPLTPQSSREDDGRGSRKRSAPGLEGVPGLNDALDAGHSAKRPRIVRGRQGVVHDHLKGRSGRR